MGFDIYGLNPKQHNEKPEILNNDYSDLTKGQEELRGHYR